MTFGMKRMKSLRTLSDFFIRRTDFELQKWSSQKWSSIENNDFKIFKKNKFNKKGLKRLMDIWIEEKINMYRQFWKKFSSSFLFLGQKFGESLKKQAEKIKIKNRKWCLFFELYTQNIQYFLSQKRLNGP